MVIPGGKVFTMAGIFAQTPLTTAKVEALPVLRISRRTDWWPLTRTMFCCGGPPEWT